MYWYNRVNKAKKKCSNQKAIEAIEKLYNDHKKIATEKKRQVKNGKLSYGEFDNFKGEPYIFTPAMQTNV